MSEETENPLPDPEQNPKPIEPKAKKTVVAKKSSSNPFLAKNNKFLTPKFGHTNPKVSNFKKGGMRKGT